MNPEWAVEQSSLGRVLIPPHLPEKVGLFYTSKDFGGWLDADSVTALLQFMEVRFSVGVTTFNSCNQVHGVTVQKVSSFSSRWREHAECDALICGLDNVALGIKVADCLPVTLVDPESHVVASIHSGWRGAAGQIVARALDFASQNGLTPSRTSAYLGPSIRACCLEVGEDVASAFQQNHERVEDYLICERGPRPYLDIPALTRQILVDGGVPAGQIFDSGICTRCEGSIFHSYRRVGKGGGRNLAVVAQMV